MEIRILGPLEVEGEHGPIELTRERERSLIALLALTPGRPVASDRLIDEIWPEAPAEAARHSLHVHISRIRQSLGDGVLLTKSPGYMIAVGEEDVDAQRFQRHVTEGRLAHDGLDHDAAVNLLRKALAMWRGPPAPALAGLASGQAHIGHLEELKLSALESLVESELALGHHGEVLDELTQAVEEHPFQERLWESLMLALYRSGRQADALSAYQRARRILNEELGIEPGAELRRLEDAIVLQRSELDWHSPIHPIVPPNHIPKPHTSFVGREQELAEVDKLLRGSRLLTLTGPGGSGKSRLALETATRVVDRFSEGAWVVELATTSDPGLVPEMVADVLHVRERPGQDLAARLGDFLADRSLLLIFDNCEHLLGAVAEMVTALLSTTSDLRILTTSREALGVIGETRFIVEPMPVPEAAVSDPAVLAGYDSVRLFASRAESTEPGFRLSAQTASLVAEACRRVDGLPLAIELAVGRIRGMGLSELTSQLKDSSALLDVAATTPDPRHRTLRAALQWSHDLLPTVERQALARAGVFHGAFDRPSFWAVAMPESDRAAAAEVLASLVDRSLVSREGDRMRLLETVRHFALGKLEDTGDGDESRRRHLAHYINLAEQAAEWVRTGDDLGAIPVMEDDYPNFRAALQFALSSQPDSDMAWSALRMVGALHWFWIIRGQWSDSLGWTRQALDITPDIPVLPRVYAHLAHAGMAGQGGLYEEALHAAHRARKLSLEMGFHWGIALASSIEGVAWAWRGDFEKARAVFDRWQHEPETGREPLAEAMLDFNRGWVLAMVGDTSQAKELLERSVEASRQRGFAFGTGCAAIELARIARLDGDLDRAENFGVEAVELFAALGSGWWIGAQAFHNLALTARARGDLNEAEKRVSEGFDMANRYGNPLMTAELFEAQAGLRVDTKDFRAAAQLMGAAEAVRNEIGAPPPPSARPRLQADHQAIEEALEPHELAAARDAGSQLTLELAAGSVERLGPASPV